MYNTKIYFFNDCIQIKRYAEPPIYDGPKRMLSLDEYKYKNYWFWHDKKIEYSFNKLPSEWECINPFDGEVCEFKNFDEKLNPNYNDSLYASLSRTKSMIRKICIHNRQKFKYFCTFTFSPEFVDRYNYKDVSQCMCKYLAKIRRYYNDIVYIIIPELHKDGAIHFHGLFSDEISQFLVFSGHNVKGSCAPIYNISNFSYGFTTVTSIINKERTASYVLKYITKDLCAVSFGKKRYWHSKGICDWEVYTEMNYNSYSVSLSNIIQHKPYICNNHCAFFSLIVDYDSFCSIIYDMRKEVPKVCIQS